MKRPDITPGEWTDDNGCIWDAEGDVIATNRDRADAVNFDPRCLRKKDKAHACAIAALPAILDALESAYLRAEKEVSLYTLLCQGSGSSVSETDFACLITIRDEYKSALLLAGYTE